MDTSNPDQAATTAGGSGDTGGGAVSKGGSGEEAGGAAAPVAAAAGLGLSPAPSPSPVSLLAPNKPVTVACPCWNVRVVLEPATRWPLDPAVLPNVAFTIPSSGAAAPAPAGTGTVFVAAPVQSVSVQVQQLTASCTVSTGASALAPVWRILRCLNCATAVHAQRSELGSPYHLSAALSIAPAVGEEAAAGSAVRLGFSPAFGIHILQDGGNDTTPRSGGPGSRDLAGLQSRVSEYLRHQEDAMTARIQAFSKQQRQLFNNQTVQAQRDLQQVLHRCVVVNEAEAASGAAAPMEIAGRTASPTPVTIQRSPMSPVRSPGIVAPLPLLPGLNTDSRRRNRARGWSSDSGEDLLMSPAGASDARPPLPPNVRRGSGGRSSNILSMSMSADKMAQPAGGSPSSTGSTVEHAEPIAVPTVFSLDEEVEEPPDGHTSPSTEGQQHSTITDAELEEAAALLGPIPDTSFSAAMIAHSQSQARASPRRGGLRGRGSASIAPSGSSARVLSSSVPMPIQGMLAGFRERPTLDPAELAKLPPDAARSLVAASRDEAWRMSYAAGSAWLESAGTDDDARDADPTDVVLSEFSFRPGAARAQAAARAEYKPTLPTTEE